MRFKIKKEIIRCYRDTYSKRKGEKMPYVYLSVEYMLDQEEVERLKKIVGVYQKQGLNLDMEEQFEMIMKIGSKKDIDEKFKFHEHVLGIENMEVGYGRNENQ